MIATWPADLPQKMLIEGYQEQVADDVLEQEMERGPAKTRMVSVAGTYPIQAQTILSFDQRARLLRFLADEAGRGALPFYFPDPLLDGLTLDVDGVDGDGEAISLGPLMTEDDEEIIIDAFIRVRFDRQRLPTFAPRKGAWVTCSFGLLVLPL